MYKNLKNKTKAVLIGKFVSLKFHIIKENKNNIKDNKHIIKDNKG